jgi:hypothetical protein
MVHAIENVLHLKGRLGWSERYMALDIDGDGTTSLRIWATRTAFVNGKAPQSDREIAGTRELPARRSSIIGTGGGERFPFEISLVGGKIIVLASSDADLRAAWVEKLVLGIGGGASLGDGAEEDEDDEEAERIASWEAAVRMEQFEARFGAAQLEACRAAMVGADDGDQVLNKNELSAALESLGIKLPQEELRALIDATDVDGDGATDFAEFLDLFALVKQADASHKLARAIRRVASKNGMRMAVHAVHESLAKMSTMLVRGFEVLKFPHSGKPSVRVLWLQSHGTLCLDKHRPARATELPSKRSMRLEHITTVEVGADHAVFQNSPKKASLVDGKEGTLVSVFGKEGAPSFHFACDSEAAAEVFAHKFRSLKAAFDCCPDSDSKWKLAVNYGTHCRLVRPPASQGGLAGFGVCWHEGRYMFTAGVEVASPASSPNSGGGSGTAEAAQPKFIRGMKHGGARTFWAEYSDGRASVPWTQFVDFFTMEFMEGQPDMTAAQEQALKIAIDSEGGDGAITTREFDRWATTNKLGASWTPPEPRAVSMVASPPAAPSVAERASSGLDRARAGKDKMQVMLDSYSSTIAWVDGVLVVVALVPGLHGVCTELRGMLNRVAGAGDAAQDVVDMMEKALEAMEDLRLIERAAAAAGGEVKAQLEKNMVAVRKVLADIAAAIDAIGTQGFLKAFFKAAKSAKALVRLAVKLEKSLDRIHKTLNLASFNLALEGRFKAGAMATQQLEEQLEKDGGEADDEDDRAAAARIVLANPQAVGAVAAAAGLSEDVFKKEMEQLGYQGEQVLAGLAAQSAAMARISVQVEELGAKTERGFELVQEQQKKARAATEAAAAASEARDAKARADRERIKEETRKARAATQAAAVASEARDAAREEQRKERERKKIAANGPLSELEEAKLQDRVKSGDVDAALKLIKRSSTAKLTIE